MLRDQKIHFDNRAELDEALGLFEITESALNYAYFLFKIRKNKDSFERLLGGTIELFVPSRCELKLDASPYLALKPTVNGIPSVVGVESLTFSEEKEIRAKINHCIEILDKLEVYQTRLKEKIADEKEFQRFLFPILKSHFIDLVDESGLPKYAGYSQVPDFGILSARLSIECKYLRDVGDFKTFRREIGEDLLGYLSKTSPYSFLLVVIYNSTNRPIPANYQSDLEENDRIVKVIVTPGIEPKQV